MESLFRAHEEKRVDSFKVNPDLNSLIKELSELLKPIQLKKQKVFTENKYPILFIIGNPRSGTTLMLQWVASLKVFSYPSNVLNRFAFAPYIGAIVQQILFNEKYDFHNEFFDLKDRKDYSSDLGKTKGALAVSEFQHFYGFTVFLYAKSMSGIVNYF